MLLMNPESDTVKAQFLLEDFLSVETPKGYKAELLDGEIVVTVPFDADRDNAMFLLDDFLSISAPKGYRVELIDGEIVVSPPPSGNHDRAIWRIVSQIARHSAVEMDFSGTKGLIVPSKGVDVAGRVIPDGTFAPTELDLFHDASPWMPAAEVSMVLEVTSSRAERDREGKRRAYAAAGIPLYLLVDRELRRVTLYSTPVQGEYARGNLVSYGEKLDLPEPFDFALDTAPFAD